MIQYLAAIAIVVQTPLQEVSPLQVQANALTNSPPQVQYEFIKEVVPGYGVTLPQYLRLPRERQVGAALSAYYLQALDRAMLVYRGDAELVAILESFKTAADAERVMLEFEATYRRKFKTWPPVVPVDVDAFINRMLSQRTIR